MEEKQTMTNNQIKHMLSLYRTIDKVLSALVVAFIIISIILCFVGAGAFGVILGIVSFIALNIVLYNIDKKINKILTDNIINNVVKDVFGDSAKYELYSRVEPAPEGFPSPHDRVHGRNNIVADYDGIHIGLSNITLVRNVHCNGEPEEATIAPEKFFEGQWLICDFGKELLGEVFIYANPEKGKPAKERDAMMNYRDFDNCFCVKTKNPEEALSILTPHMMDLILEIENKVNSPMYIAFLRSGRIHIAFDTKRDILDLGDTKADYDILYRKFFDELKWIADIIDGLLKENTFCK
ncbi:MAG: DUF3137 domain-containing protein [Lachnospira sp.]